MDCNLQKNCKNLHYVHASKTESEVEVFFDFSSFHYHLGKVSRHIKIIKKLSNTFSFFFAIYKKIAKFSILSTRVLNEVIFDFSSFHYHLGKVSRHIKIIKNLNNCEFSNELLFFFCEDCNSQKNCK